MTIQQKIEAINACCLSSEYSTLYKLLNELPGSFAILISDRPAETKRQKLLELLELEGRE